jgi:glycosyltransferase involved in cell wall biosynthesis
MKLIRANYFIISEGGIAKSGIGLKEKLKKWILRGAKHYFCGASMGDDYFIKYGAKKDQISRYPFTSFYDKEILKRVIEPQETSELKSKHGIQYKKVLISVGQIIHRKGFDILIKAIGQREFNDLGVYIIGGAPTSELVELIDYYKLNNIHFIEFISKEKLIEFYKLANLFVLATREDTYGLVINEAMSQGLPIITSRNCVAGVELIHDGINGYLFDSEDYLDLSNKIELILKDNNQAHSMSVNNLVKMKEYSFEKMAQILFSFVKEFYDAKS